MSIREFARPRAAFTIVLACLAALVAPGIAGATTLPAGFQQTTAISGLNTPMDVEVTPAGQVFVAEKSGIVKSFSSLSDPTPTVAADLRTQVHNFSARGLMSLAVDPDLPGAAVHLRLLHAGRPDRRHAAPVRRPGRDLGQLREGASGPRRELHRGRSHLAAADRGRGDDRLRAGAGRGLVPAVPGPYRRRTRASAPTATSTSPAATAPPRPSGTTATPARRPTPAATRPARSATCSQLRPPRAAACACRTCARPATPPASTAR